MNSRQGSAATQNSTGSAGCSGGGGAERSTPRPLRRQKNTQRKTMVTTTEASCTGHILLANAAAGSATRFAASRLVRLDTGSSRLAVLASHTVVMASGITAIPALRARASITGVSSTAVVSRFSTVVVAAAKNTHRTKRAG